MKVYLFFIILLCFGVVSALTMYGGETLVVEFARAPTNCSLIGNTTNLDGLNYSLSGVYVTIETEINYQPDNFTLECFDEYSGPIEEIDIHEGGYWVNNNKNLLLTSNETIPVGESPEDIPIEPEPKKKSMLWLCILIGVVYAGFIIGIIWLIKKQVSAEK